MTMPRPASSWCRAPISPTVNFLPYTPSASPNWRGLRWRKTTRPAPTASSTRPLGSSNDTTSPTVRRTACVSPSRLSSTSATATRCSVRPSAPGGSSCSREPEDLSPYQLLGAGLDLALASVLVGDLVDATKLLDDAERKLTRLPDTGTLDAAATAIRARLEAARLLGAGLVEPLSPAELRVLAYLPTHLTFGEIGELLFVSRNTVKSQAIAIYRKLAVSSRGAAVAEARRIGLLQD